MSWIGISTGRRTVLAPAGSRNACDALLATGTILIELEFSAVANGTQVVVDLERSVDWPRRFRVTLGSDGLLHVLHRQGTATRAATLKFPRPDQEACLRIALAWHAPERFGLISVENLDTGEVTQSIYEDPNPWPLDDLAALISLGKNCVVDPSITLLACSDRIEPVGLNTGFAAGTLVDTTMGRTPVEALRPGDLVATSAHGFQPVLAVLEYQVPTFGRFAPVHLRAPFFGLKCDLVVAPNHRLLISGVDAEYLFGSDEVLVEARHLARTWRGHSGATQSRTIRYAQVLLDTHVCLSVSGAWGESLFLGDLADNPTRHASSTVAGVPVMDLPRHTRIASPQLRSYEAMVLISAMCA